MLEFFHYTTIVRFVFPPIQRTGCRISGLLLSDVDQVYNRDDYQTWLSFLSEHNEEQIKYRAYRYFAKGWMLCTHNTLPQFFLGRIQKWNMPVASWTTLGGECVKGLLLAKDKLVCWLVWIAVSRLWGI